jgi:hypothetical protein
LPSFLRLVLRKNIATRSMAEVQQSNSVKREKVFTQRLFRRVELQVHDFPLLPPPGHSRTAKVRLERVDRLTKPHHLYCGPTRIPVHCTLIKAEVGAAVKAC